VKVILVVAGTRRAGQEVPVSVSPFLIGRAPECHLRPASALVSNRHCALLLHGDAPSLHDLNSANGTFVNGTRIQGEARLKDGDRVEIGPLKFDVRVQVQPPVDMPTPVPPGKAWPPDSDVEEAAAVILCEDDEPAPPAPVVDAAGVPIGDTALAVPPPGAARPPQSDRNSEPPKQDTSTAARDLLKRYRKPHIK
jgi:pSer/pThr/pTyr-binding forkhead associated (FHA) protein